jgi:sugar phosphate isomerase/epimerase
MRRVLWAANVRAKGLTDRLRVAQLGGFTHITVFPAAFAERARRHGLVTTLEFMPVSGIRDLELAWQIVRPSLRPDTGICFDSWHFFRGTPDMTLLRGLPGGAITEVQMSDASREVVGDLLNDLLHHRLPPGQGDFDLVGVVSALKATKNYRSVGPEMFSDAIDALDVDAVARICRQSAEAWL